MFAGVLITSLKLVNFLVSSFAQTTEAYSELCKTSKMERFAEKVNGSHPLIIFAKYSIFSLFYRVWNTPLSLTSE